MENEVSYDFGEDFARLTCIFEDAAGLASEGQAAGLSIERCRSLASELRVFADQADVELRALMEKLGS